MTTLDVTKVREWLDREYQSSREDLAQIERDIAALARDEGEEGGVPTNHMADEGSSVYERERLATIQDELNERLDLVRMAQERLDAGTYGTCQRCRKQIAEGRLEALPFAAYCIECQEIVDGEQHVSGVKGYQPLT